MHMWTSASPAERNWVVHERIQMAKRSNLGFAKLAQLVEITTNLKLASCRQQGGGYVLPWFMDGVDTERRLPDEDEDYGDLELDVWGARPVGTFTDREIRRQINVFRKDGTSRPREVSAVFGDRAATVLPFDHVPPPPSRGAGEGSVAAAEDGEDDWTDAEDVARGTHRTAEQVYFTYGGGSDGHASRTSVITDNVADGAHGSATRHPPAVRGRGAVARDVHPRARRVLGVESSDEDEGVAPHADHLRDSRFDLSHHSREHSEHLCRSHRLAERSVPASQQPQDIPVAEGTPSHSGPAQAATSSLRTSDFDIAGSHGGSPVLRCRVPDRPDYSTDVREREETVEERDARLDREEEARLQSMPRWEGREAYEAEQRRQRELEMIGAGAPSSVGRMPTSDTMQPPSGPSHVMGGGADTCGFPAGGGGAGRFAMRGWSCRGCRDNRDRHRSGELRRRRGVCGRRGYRRRRRDWHCAAGTDGGTHGGEEGIVDEGSVPLPQEELADEGSVRLPQEELVDEGSVPLPQEELVDEGSVLLSQEELDEGDLALPEEELVDEGSVPLEGSVPFEAFVDGATEDDEEGVAVDAGHSAPFAQDGVTGGHVEEEGAAIDMSLAIIVRPPTINRPNLAHDKPTNLGGILGGWSSCRRVTDILRRDYDRGRGLFARGPLGEGDPAAGASKAGRPSVHTGGRILGLDRVETRRTKRLEVYLARSAIDDRRQGLLYTSGEEDLHMPQGSRHHGSIRDLDAEVAADQQRLADLIRERERRSETEAQAEEADTKTEPIDTAMRTERHRRVASAAGSHLAHVGRQGAPRSRGQSGQRGALVGRGSAARHSTHTRRGSRG
ncbi:hypothetical protein CBR_g25784 [Chara braunii]|uniref:Uncharacterized protein n=1 Tax=Chara braunii TaxID=69332 RepID=A0A388L6L9_CHABU|nr:hypothetical protein CBR_g25784 [Chara braunii]|eukprot:GBG77853.1 hypothetical protein CBR_g25784 [Chara braunii]